MTIIDDNNEENISLSKRSQRFSAKQSNITIRFTNDNGPRDVHFHSDEQTSIASEYHFKIWNCGLSSEDAECDMVRNGILAWGGTYTIKFNGKKISVFLSSLAWFIFCIDKSILQ